MIRSGPRLLLDGESFTFSGVNIYWLGQDENNPDTPLGDNRYTHPSAFRWTVHCAELQL